MNEYQYDTFLSHNSKDKPAVEWLAAKLTDQAGLTILSALSIRSGSSSPVRILKLISSPAIGLMGLSFVLSVII